MRGQSVLILGGLGDVAQSMVDVISVRLPSTRVHLADARKGQAGARSVTRLPRAEDDSYPIELQELVERVDPDVIIPTNEGEIRRLLAAGIDRRITQRLLIETREHINLFGDKFLTYEWSIENGIPAVPTFLSHQVSEADLPLLVKPRQGSGGKGQTIVRDSSELEKVLPQLDESFVLQPYIAAAQEFTCIAARLGSDVRTLVLERTLRGFRSNWVRVADDATVIEIAHRTAALLGPQHSLNFQFLRLGPVFGLIDVNPRFSSTVAMRDVLGFSDLMWALHRVFGLDQVVYEPPRVGTVVEWGDGDGRTLVLKDARADPRQIGR